MSWKTTLKRISEMKGPGKALFLGLLALSSFGVLVTAQATVQAEETNQAASPAAVTASEARNGCSECYRVDVILIEGLLRTRREVVERELTFQEGDIASVADVEKSVQRLRNTGIFLAVEYELLDQQVGVYGENPESADAVEGRLLHLRVDERWTLMPNFGFGSGGQTFQLRVGLQDANLFGTFMQAGGSYTRIGETNSFLLWFRDPRFLNRRLRLSVDGALNNRTYSFYEPDGELSGGYLLTRRRGSLGLLKEWRSWLRTAAHAAFWADTFSYNLVSEERREGQEERGGLPSAMQTLQLGVSSGIGRVNQNKYRYSGTSLTTRYDHYFHFGEGAPQGQRLETTLRHSTQLPLKSEFALRASLGTSWMEPEHEQFFIGGLDALRGTVDMRYRGAHYWLTNVEYRIPSVELPWIVVQHVAFVDAVGVADRPAGLVDLTAATTGIGLRLISPTIYGLLMRIDYAVPFYTAEGPGFSFGAHGHALSFGAGQFF